jgi:cytochrome c-type biogenesis protein CcmH
MRRILLAATLALGLLIGLWVIVGVAAAQQGTPPAATPQSVTADDVNRVARQLYCPVCENEPLDACRTSACQQWRAQIAQLLSEGQSDDQIKQYFVDRYGLRVLGEPPASGTTLWLWVLPIAVLVVGAVYVVFLMRRMRARSAAAESTQPAPTQGDDYTQRVERDLKKW